MDAPKILNFRAGKDLFFPKKRVILNPVANRHFFSGSLQNFRPEFFFFISFAIIFTI
jgi:hypothetical protein